jgi:CheY-like chemotaxis protein
MTMAAHILLVDDDLDLRPVLAEVLRGAGYEVREAGSGAEAMAALDSGHPIDLILSDYLMRNGDGLDLLRYLRAKGGQPPVFFLMTGHSEVRSEDAKQMGVSEFILKPFDVVNLLETIEKYLAPT